MGSHYLTEGGQPAVATLDMFEKIKHLLPEPPTEIIQLMTERTVESENFKKRKIVGKDKNWGEMSESAKFTGGQEWNITK